MYQNKATLGPEFFGKNFNPNTLTAKLKEYGFTFISETCPVKFDGRIDQVQNKDGSVTFIQTLGWADESVTRWEEI